MIFNVTRPLLHGFSQIMLQKNAATGLLFLLGIAYGSINMALAALLAVASASLAAFLLRFERSALQDGLYGFSAALVGVALLLFFKAHWVVWLAVVVGAVLAMLLQALFLRLNIPVFTLPFILVTWLCLWLGQRYAPELLAPSAAVFLAPEDLLGFAIKGFGQVIFQDSLVAGGLFFIAVYIANPLAALYALAASTLCGVLAALLGVDMQSIALGLLSFNAALTAIVFAGANARDAHWCLIAVLLTLTISLVMLYLNFVQLTFPFVAASMLVLMIKKSLN